MNIYLIFQNEREGFDTYDSAVVIAPSSIYARRIFPGSEPNDPGAVITDCWNSSAWASDIKNVQAIKIGYTSRKRFIVMVCASFHAG